MIARRVKATARFFLIVIGIIAVLTEEFLWSWTGHMMAMLGRWEPVARLERAIARLSPYPAMVLFIFPWAIILPVKLIAIYYIGTGKFLRGSVLFIVGEVLGIAILARLYEICRPSLLQLTWFTYVERFVVGCTKWAHQLLETVPAYRRARQLVMTWVARGSTGVQRVLAGFRRAGRPTQRRPTF